MKINQILALFVLLTFWYGQNLYGQSVTIDLNVQHQIVHGFGGMNHTVWIDDLNEDQREKAFGNNPGEIGMSILRMHIDPNQNVWERELPTALHALDKGALVFATPWDPPASLLDQSNTEQNKIPYVNYGGYVDHLNSFNTYMSNNDVPLYAISIQNEPDWGEWTRWTANEILTFMKENAQDIENRVMAPESFQFRRGMSDPILNDPTATDNLDILGAHIYGGGLSSYPLAQEKGKEVWMTEHYTSSDRSANLWPDALGVGKEIHDCMNANYSAYVWWYIRRFYGLLTDDGNISKRGYVFSQYSKFIRPGAKRIGVTSSGSGVNVSAYESDGDLVIVAVNNTNSTKDFDFSIVNGPYEKLTGFSTSENKNMVNVGDFEINNGSFSSSVGPQSIVTFTSNPQNGGKADNQSPIAVAGEDLSITDDDINGVESVLLDGSGSSDSDGNIANFSWSVDGNQISFLESENLNLPLGQHEIQLTVTDNDGATSTDVVMVEIKISETEDEKFIWLDAECGVVGSTWMIEEDMEASNEKYVTVTSGIESLANASELAEDKLVYTFEVSTEGIYKLWGLVRVPTPNDDSFWIKMDDGNWILWNSITGGNNWAWDDIHNSNGTSEAETYNLSVGTHTLQICYREDGADLDKLLLTNTGIVPAGIGEKSTLCDVVDVENQSQSTKIQVYPNPSIDGNFRFSELENVKEVRILNIHGKVVFERMISNQKELDIQLNNTAGLYIVRFIDDNNIESVEKLIVL